MTKGYKEHRPSRLYVPPSNHHTTSFLFTTNTNSHFPNQIPHRTNTNTMSNQPSQLNGQINSVVGSVEQIAGKVIEAGVSPASPSSPQTLCPYLRFSFQLCLRPRPQFQAVGGSTEPSVLTKDGKERHDKGEAEIKAAEAKQYAEGTVDRVVGKKGESRAFVSFFCYFEYVCADRIVHARSVDAIVGAITGDSAQELSGNAQKESGHAQQKLATS
jgi:uncharacterized protein YjbJ (UPF0337 family)